MHPTHAIGHPLRGFPQARAAETQAVRRTVLPPGIVCDPCNNYFARKVEKPFLDAPSIVALRFHQAVPNKRGRVPPLQGILTPGFEVLAHRHLEGPFIGSLTMDPAAVRHVLKSEKGMLILPVGGDPPADAPVSRFLAKVALEAMAQRLLGHPDGLAYLVDECQLDPLRNHARRGDTPNWPYHSRRIYEADKRWRSDTDQAHQVVHEYDFLQTETGEMYFILAFFGLELSLNLGGPEIDGYTNWLGKHGQASPLYSGKNSHPHLK